ncbi:MAG: hypothetical protein ACRC33_10160 [Gemmataceae bacterium]
MNLCQETSGFLFKHGCGRPSFLTCGLCHKPVCAQHARPAAPEGFRCIACALAGGPPPAEDTSAEWDDDDPYFYSGRHHADSGGPPDGMDFTDGDRASTGAGGDWEDDAGGS